MTSKKIIPILVFLIALNVANAISFYEGTVAIKSLNVDVNVQQKADVVLNYTLSGDEKVNLNFEDVPESAQITANGQTYGKSFDLEVKGDVAVTVRYNADVGAETIKEISINPNILFNNMVSSNRVNSYSAKIVMPSGVNELLSSSEAPTEIKTEGGRKTFLWQKINAYASTLTIDWHTLNVNIGLERIVPNEITDEFVVKNVIRNNGNDISNVRLVQSFLEGDFDPVEPLGEFERIQTGNDRRLEWKKEISSIPGGSVNEFSYRLKVLNRGENVVFRPLYVYVGGTLVKIVEKAEYTTGGVSSAVIANETSIPETTEATGIKPGIEPEIAVISPITTPEEEGVIPPKEEKAPEEAQKSIGEQFNFKSITGNRSLFWAIALILALLAVVLLFVLLNRRKEKGIKY